LTDLLKETSLIPKIAKRYLKVIVESKDDLILFIEQYKHKNESLMGAIGDFRMMKLKQRTFTIEEFVEAYADDCMYAIQKLFLYPPHESFDRYIINPIADGEFYLSDLFNFHMENLNMNPILAGKILKQKSELP
jgi:hypothetical protein